MSFEKFYNKNYKKLLIAPALLLLLSLAYLGYFFIENNDIINKDVSLTGGTTITLFTDKSVADITNELSKELRDFDIRAITGSQGDQRITIIIQTEKIETVETILENLIGEELSQENSSIETTSSSLGQDFYKQLIIAVLLAFFWMAAVVFLIFADNKKIKTYVVLLNIFLGFFLGLIFFKLNISLSIILFLILAGILIYTYARYSTPAFAVMFAAFADIVMTLAVVNLIGMKISSAGIVAFLMLIGYSVDTDILLTTRVLKRKGKINSAMFNALKTGMTMTLTSLITVATALIVVYSFGSILNQIFSILLIGLGFDLFNTWVSNASLIKWYAEKK